MNLQPKENFRKILVSVALTISLAAAAALASHSAGAGAPVLIADKGKFSIELDGKPIGDKEGPFKLVATEDKRPARCVHNLVSIELRTAE